MHLHYSTTGVLLLDKPAGMSSARALGMVKRKLRLEKAGHCGTLDPMATGLLVLLAGGATRINNYVQAGRKRYTGKIRLGLLTDSDDISGTVLTESSFRPDQQLVLEKAASFVGKIKQVPPQVSALKVGGERAYERARRGETSDLAPRDVEIFSFTMAPVDADEWAFSVECSKGTYIRSLARELGEQLGCGACLSALRREVSVPFSVAQARTIDDITLDDLRPWPEALPHLRSFNLRPEAVRRLNAGDQSVLTDIERCALAENLNGSGLLAGQAPGTSPYAIFKDAGTGRACGLLVNEGRVWKLVCNLEAPSQAL